MTLPPPASAVHGPSKREDRGRFWLVTALLLTWSTTIFGILMLPFALAALVPLVARQSWKCLAVFALASPMFISFVVGVTSYASGSAKLKYMGLPGTQFFNLDPQLRCERSTGGCVVNGTEWMTRDFNNAAVRLMTQMLGPQRGAYRGPYPMNNECESALTSAVPIQTSAFAADKFVVNSTQVVLAHGVGKRLLNVSQLEYMEANAQSYTTELAALGPIRATIWKQQCLIIAIPVNGDVNFPGSSACIAAIDLTTGRPFAYYGRGQYSHRGPPVPWRE